MAPMYEYQCQDPDCNHEFEELQQDFEAQTICPKCLKNSLKKKMSKNSFHLKGFGWTNDQPWQAKNYYE